MPQDVPRGRERQYDRQYNRMGKGSPLSGYRVQKKPVSVMAFDEHYSDSQLAKRATRTVSMTSAELPPPDVSLPVLEDIVDHHTTSVQLFREKTKKAASLG